jgi:hypothetical protein
MDRLFSARTKRIALVVLAVTLVALAGCSTGGNGGDGTPTANQTTPEPTAEPTPEPTTTDEPSPPPESDIDPAELAASHTAQIEAATSVTAGQQVQQRQVLDGNTSVGSQQLLGYYDLENSIGLVNSSQTSQSQLGSVSSSAQQYTASNETFLRQNSTRLPEPQYSYDAEPYNMSQQPTPVNFTGIGWGQFYETWNPSLQSQGETEFQGETVEEYRAEGQNSLPYLSETLGNSFQEIDTINATTLVTDDGLATYTVIQVSGTGTRGGEITTTFQFTVTGVNETTVPEPAWLEQVNTTG